MTKFLKVSFPQKCIGCELCVLEAQRQLEKISLEGSVIRILKNKKANSEFLEYSIDLDPRINSLDINKIRNICPTGVFEIVEEEENGLI
jgi:NAD-dependent dihydropyrimidine dehydrogenase PreA subunit